jgi:hypothetical protein
MECDEDCYDESYLFEDRLDDIDKDEDEEINFEAMEKAQWLSEITDEEDEIPF